MAQQFTYVHAPQVVVTGPVTQLARPSGSAVISSYVGPTRTVMTPYPPPSEAAGGGSHVLPPYLALSPRVVQRSEQPQQQQQQQQAGQRPAKQADASPCRSETEADASPCRSSRKAAADSPQADASPCRSNCKAAADFLQASAVEAKPEPGVPQQPEARPEAQLPAGEDSPRRDGCSSRGGDSPRRAGSPGAKTRRANEPQRAYGDLYQEASGRRERRLTRQETREQDLEREMKQRLEDYAQGMKERRRLYRTKAKDTRTHLEREKEMLRKREETRKKKVAQTAQESEELGECTFHPKVSRSRDAQRRSSPSPRRSPSPKKAEVANEGGVVGKMLKIADRQRMATDSLRLVAVDESQLREDLRTVQNALHERFQQQETERVVEMLKRGDTSSSTYSELIQRVQATVAAGNDPAAVQVLMADLVGVSSQEVERRTSQAMAPKRLDAETALYKRRVALVKELEAVENEAVDLAALHGGSLQELAREVGMELGLAEHALRSLPSKPGCPAAAPLLTESPKLHGTPGFMTLGSCPEFSQAPHQSLHTPRTPASECTVAPRKTDTVQPLIRRLEFKE